MSETRRLSQSELIALIQRRRDELIPPPLASAIDQAFEDRPASLRSADRSAALPVAETQSAVDQAQTDLQLQAWVYYQATVQQLYTLLGAFDALLRLCGAFGPLSRSRPGWGVASLTRAQMTLVPGQLQAARMAMEALKLLSSEGSLGEG